jgi:lipopolysaccharide transport system ATP-binding protein
MSDRVIHVERLGKLYQLAHQTARHTSFREALTAAALAPLRRFRQLQGTDVALEDFWALRDVNFSVRPGEVVGSMIRNGAGKTRCSKFFPIAEPSEGAPCCAVALLSPVGTGFHQD